MPLMKAPRGYRTLTPVVITRRARELIAFCAKVFGATQRVRLDFPDGAVSHAELEIGDSVLMVGSPSTGGSESTARLMVYVDDCDATVQRAVDGGARIAEPAKDQFYGDRTAIVVDPFGNEWLIAMHKEDVGDDEMQRRFRVLMGGR